MACPEVFVFTWNFLPLFRKVSTGWLVIFFFSSLNASWCFFSYFHFFFPLILLRYLAIWFKFLINLWWNFKKLSTFFILVGIFHSMTAFTLLFSICTSPYPTTTSRIEISLASKSHFDHLKHRLCFSAIFKNQIFLSSSFFLVLVDICYRTLWTWIIFLFLLFSDFIGIFVFFWMMKRHVTLQSHDMSHDVTS